MLLKLKIKNFRSIKDEVALDLQATADKSMKAEAVFESSKTALLKIAAIYGANASGKTNILKAFSVFRTMVLESLLRSNVPWALPAEFFKLSDHTENEPSFFEITFLLEKDILEYGFEINKHKVVREWLKKRKSRSYLFERTGQLIHADHFSDSSEELTKQTKENVLFLSVLAANNKPLSKKIINFFQNTNLIFGAKRGNTLNYTFSKFLTERNFIEKIKVFIKEADFGVVDITANERSISSKEIQNMPDKFKEFLFNESSKVVERNLHFLHKKYGNDGRELGTEPLNFFSEESDGTQQMFALSAPVIDTLENGKVLFIDELEASLHPLLCQYLVLLFNSKIKNPNNAQLIFTTHNTSLLNEELLRRDEIYFTEKNATGATELFSLASISERKHLNFAKRYLEGRYGALPYHPDLENIKISRNK